MFNRIWNIFFGPKRVVIVHVHIFKNAGTTFDWILKKNFGEDFIDHRDDKDMIEGGASYLKKFLIDNPNVKAISSHHIYFDPKTVKIPNTLILPVYLLRHPIERTMSVYKFEKKQPISTPGSIKAKELDFNDYVAWRMTPEAGGTIRNANSLFCAGLGPKEVDETAFLQAKTNLMNTQLVGVVDRFDESIKIFEKEFKKYYPNIDMSYIKQNVNQSEEVALSEKIASVTDSLSEENKEKLNKNNEFDTKLYDFANDLIKSRFNDIQ